MVQAGLAEMSSKEATNEEAALFNGPETTVKSGAPVPILYGQLEVGGVTLETSDSIQKANLTGIILE